MKLRIVVFDDDVEIRNMLQTALSGKGHKVTAYADPTEFSFFNKEKCPCRQEEPCADILIADIVMPNVMGVDFFKKLKEGGCHPFANGNVAIMSGYLTIHYMNELNKLGIYYFRKPLHLNELFKWVDECHGRIQAASGRKS